MSDAIARFAPSERTLPAMLAQQCARFAERTLLVCSDTRWTYAQALRNARVGRIADHRVGSLDTDDAEQIGRGGFQRNFELFDM